MFNISNILAAASAALALGVPLDAVAHGIAEVQGVPGRMERIDEGQDFTAIVDFAHTPNALHRALEAVRPLTGPKGRVIVVFGSAGLRDHGKRRMMGEVAGKFADLVVLTAEDPRTESLKAIMAEIELSCREAGGEVMVEPDRYRAIALALQAAEQDDSVVICGKGHEQSMCFGEVEYDWDDSIALAHALDVYLGKDSEPPPMLLPTYSYR